MFFLTSILGHNSLYFYLQLGLQQVLSKMFEFLCMLISYLVCSSLCASKNKFSHLKLNRYKLKHTHTKRKHTFKKKLTKV